MDTTSDIADEPTDPDSETIAVIVRDPGWRTLAAAEGFPLEALCRQAAAAAAGAAAAPAGVELSVVLADDALVQRLNRDYRGQDRPTNVLAFPALEPGAAEAGPPLAGDVVVARETVAREAADAGKAARDRLAHLVVHGVLHLFGFDHGTDAEAAVMERREAMALAVLGIADPYAEAAPDGGHRQDEAFSTR